MTLTTPARFAVPDTSVAPIFDGWQAGHFDLPELVTAPAAEALELTAEAAALSRGQSGAWWRTGDSLAEREAFDVAEDRRNLARTAARQALQRVEGLVGATGDMLVTDYLRPAHAAALAGVRAILPAIVGVDLADPVAVARAGAKAAAAYLVVAAAADRLRAIETARECIYDRQRLGGSWRDPFAGDRHGGALRDTSRWPDPIIATTSAAARVRVGPSHPLVRTAWLATDDGAGWCPTWREWEAAFLVWAADPARNGIPTGRVPIARNAHVTRAGRR